MLSPTMLFACLYTAPRSDAAPAADALLALARDFSPRIEVHAPHLITLDVSGLRTLLGPPRVIGEELRKSAADRGLYVHVAICVSRAASVVLAAARAGLTVVDAGTEPEALAPLPLRALEAGLPFIARVTGPEPSPRKNPALDCLATFRRWGLKTIADVAVLSPAAVFERTSHIGVAWHRLANGADPRPLVPDGPDERFEETLELEWPIDGLEPLSFVLGRLFDLLCAHLERRDRGVAVLHVRLRLVTRETYARRLELPTPIRDARALRTLTLLDLESHPPSAAIDAVTVAADPTPGRVLQYSLLARALPAAERVSTLVARLTAMMGEGRVGSPALVDSFRPGAFEMRPFTGMAPRAPGPGPRAPDFDTVQSVLRRFRQPIAARVVIEDGRPVRVTTDRRGFGGGRIESCAGPWRSSGEWWHHGFRLRVPAPPPPETREWVSTQTSRFGVRGAIVPDPASTANDREAQADYIYALNFLVRESPAALVRERAAPDGPLFPSVRPAPPPWNIDEWDVALADGAAYRLARDRETERWYISGVID